MAGKSTKALIATTVDPDVDLSDRDAVLSSINDELRKEYQHLVQMFAGQLKKSVLFYYEVGCVIKKIYHDAATYGTHAVEKIAVLLGVERTLLYRMMQFHAAFSRSELEAILSKSESNGACALSWSHFVLLLGVRDKEQRQRLLEEAVTKNMTVEELRSILRMSRASRSDRTLEPSLSKTSVVSRSSKTSRKVEAPVLPADEVFDVASLKESLDYFLDYLSRIYEDLKRVWTNRCLIPLQKNKFVQESDHEELSEIIVSIQDVREVAHSIQQYLADMDKKMAHAENAALEEISEVGAKMIEETEEEHRRAKVKLTVEIQEAAKRYSQELGLTKVGRIEPDPDDPDDSGSFEDEEEEDEQDAA